MSGQQIMHGSTRSSQYFGLIRRDGAAFCAEPGEGMCMVYMFFATPCTFSADPHEDRPRFRAQRSDFAAAEISSTPQISHSISANQDV
jgi:hypothetical protein